MGIVVKRNKYKKYKTNEEFITLANIIHSNNKYNYDNINIINARIKIKIKCNICNYEFYQSPFRHLSGQGCPNCRYINNSEKRKFTKKQFIEKAFQIHGDKNDYSKFIYKGSQVKGCITCKVNKDHGDYWQYPNSHLQGHGCPKCGFEYTTSLKRLTIKKFIKRARRIHGNKYDYSKVVYIDYHTKVIIICPEHGEFEQTPNDHLSGCGCLKCNYSKGEFALELIFNKHNIKSIPQFKLPCYKFEYDFYLPEHNILIEFHGIQHYKPIEHFGGIEYFKYIQKCDIFKRSLAKEYNIHLIEFNYKQLKELSKEEFEKLVINKINISSIIKEI